MRLFTGIGLPDQMRERLGGVIDRLRPSAGVRWSPPGNLHITTKFIGEWPTERVTELTSVLSGVPTPGPFDIHVRGLGWFPNPHTPRIFWATVDAPEALKQLAVGTDQALSQLGIEIEKRPYSPHLTLARVERGTPVGGLRQAVAQLDFADFGSFRAEHFTLYQSKTGPKGSLYTSLAEYPL